MENKKKYYYDEEKAQDYLNTYQKETIFRDGVAVYRNVKVETLLSKEVQKVVVAIIFTYGYQRFEPFEDLVQHGMMSCSSNFLKYTKEKGSSYDFFSLIAKISLLNYTIRRRKHRNGAEFEKVKNSLFVGQEYDFDNFIQEFECNMMNVIDCNFLGNKRKKYINIASLIVEYLRKTRAFVSKSDLYRWCRAYGTKQNVVREFINDVGLFYDDLYCEEINIDVKNGVNYGDRDKDE